MLVGVGFVGLFLALGSSVLALSQRWFRAHCTRCPWRPLLPEAWVRVGSSLCGKCVSVGFWGLLLTPHRLHLWICAFACGNREWSGVQFDLPFCFAGMLSFFSAELSLPLSLQLQMESYGTQVAFRGFTSRQPPSESCRQHSPSL